jgi:hypothetical protein
MFSSTLAVWFLTALLLSTLEALSAENASSAAPLSFTPSLYWYELSAYYSRLLAE